MKIVKHTAILIIIATFMSCGNFKCFDSLSCRRRYSGPGISELITTAAEQERRVKSGDESPAKLALTYQKLGEKYLENKMWNPSIETFMKALKLGRENPLVHYSLGVAYGNRGKIEKSDADIDSAEFHYRKALKINPSYKSAAYGLSILLFYMKDQKEEGVRILEDLVAGRKAYYHERMALGMFYYDMGKLATALAHYQALCADLEKARENPLILEYRKACRQNADTLMKQISTGGAEK